MSSTHKGVSLSTRVWEHPPGRIVEDKATVYAATKPIKVCTQSVTDGTPGMGAILPHLIFPSERDGV